MIKEIEIKLEDKMKKNLESLKAELAAVRTGRANPSLLNGIKAECYGSQVPIQQVATIGVPEPKLLEIRPWDINNIKDIEKAILKSQLGLTPSNDGKVIRLTLPALTEETRKNLVKHIKQIEEQHKVSVRTARREAMDEFKTAEKQKKITEDALFKQEDAVQKIADKYVHIIDDIIKNKEKEIMEV
ncbi:ribosome recycling factor [bacterium]